mmetsp:Transcript_45803/g.111520  ORF Transcript_45803/g.111520 Transcript_45803/m.111520 type:complete len:133 (-) Transcript_45803:60-458(-)
MTDSRVGSCLQVIRSNGEVFAVAHPHKKSGYKALNSETNVRTLGSKTTYKTAFEDEVDLPTVTKNPKGMTYKPRPLLASNDGLAGWLVPAGDTKQWRGVRRGAPPQEVGLQGPEQRDKRPHPRLQDHVQDSV